MPRLRSYTDLAAPSFSPTTMVYGVLANPELSVGLANDATAGQRCNRAACVPMVSRVLSMQATQVGFFDDAIAVCTDAGRGTVVHVYDASTRREVASVLVRARLTALRARPRGAGLLAIAQTGELYALRHPSAPSAGVGKPAGSIPMPHTFAR